jgi:acetoin utilization protein AcuB
LIINSWGDSSIKKCTFAYIKQRLQVIAKDLIAYEIPSISKNASFSEALILMEDSKCSHATVVDNGIYQGVIAEAEILDMENDSGKISTIISRLPKPFVNVNTHIYQVLSVINEFRISCVPVLDNKQHYIGVISLQNIAFKFAKITNVNEPGGILILEVKNRDYSLAQAAQIVESDNGKILSSYVFGNDSTATLDLVLKINKKDLSTIISAFDRYNYLVKGSYHESRFDEDMEGRYDQLMNYLNM